MLKFNERGQAGRRDALAARRCRNGTQSSVPSDKFPIKILGTMVAAAMGIGLISMSTDASAQSMDEMRRRMQTLEAQMQTLKQEMREAEGRANEAVQKAAAAERQASADANTPVKWHLSGYATTSAEVTDADSRDDTFVAGKFNPVFHFQYEDLVLFEAEMEFAVQSDGSTDVELEYSSIDLLLHDNATFVAGKFLSPIGQFQERLHPNWINKLTDAPAGFGHGGVQPLNEVGVMLRGGFAFDSLTLTYSVFAGNGPQVEFEDGDLEAIELEGFGTDNNGDKAYGGRIGVLPWPYLEIGASLMMSALEGRKETGIIGAVSDGDFTLWGVDAAYTRGPWDVRFEYLSSELDSFLSQAEAGDGATSTIPKTEWEAWYVQLAYQLSGLTDMQFVRNIEVVGRYGEVDAKGFDEFVEHTVPEQRLSFGVNYLFAPSLIGKLSLSYRDFEDAESEDFTEFRTQLAYGF